MGTDAISHQRISANTQKAGKSQNINVEDFLKLISSQLKNQDMMNPMSDTEFISQLAQFTALEVTQGIAENQSVSMAMSFIGKEVTAVATNSTGALEKTTGIVDKVSLYDGVPTIHIGEKKFSVYQIMELNNTRGGSE